MEATQDQDTGQAANPLERRVDIAITRAEIEPEVERQLKRIAKTAKMAGFRPGKVPMKMVAQMYGEEARSDALNTAVKKAFDELVCTRNLRIVGQPRLEPKSSEDAEKMEFTAIFEVYPEFQIADLSGELIERPVLAVTDVEVDKTIEVLRKQRATYEPTDHAAVKGDRLIIDFIGRKNGEAFDGGQATDYQLLIGSGVMPPDFESALEGVSAGQEKTFDVQFPSDYLVMADQLVQFTVTVKQVGRLRLPAVDADFARALGIKDGDILKMRAEVRANLEREVAKRLRTRIKGQVMNLLIETHPIAAPRAMVQAEAQQMAEYTVENLKQRNPQIEHMSIRASVLSDLAEERVKLGLIVAELVRAKDLHARPEQVRAVVDDIAAAFEDPEEVVRWYYSQPQRLAVAGAIATENNVINWALAHAQVVDKSITFAELMGHQA